jgi:signal transduction histidine kinase
MAIKVHEFFDRFYHNTLVKVVALQAVGGILAGVVGMMASLQLDLDIVASFALALITVVSINAVVAIVTLKIVSDPLRVLSQAIAHVSKDPVVTSPPDISSKSYEASGLKGLVQTVYELAINSPGGDAAVAGGVATAGPADYFRHLADTLPCGIVTMDAGGKIIYANPAAPVKPASEETVDISLLFEPKEDFTRWLEDCRANKLRDDHIWYRIADKVPSEEGRRIFDVVGHYQKNDLASIEVILVSFDRTTAYAPDQDDMDFIALAAHELRGPITVIRGYLDVLNQELGKSLDEDQHLLLDRLQVSAERLSGYINNILNVSRYDRNQFGVHLHEEHMTEIFQSLIPDLALRAKTQNRKLSFQVPDDLPTIAADRTSISEVIINLVDNAIKYSHEGGEIVIGAGVKEGFVEVTILDQGIGMPGSIVSNLFNKFYRSHHSRQSVGGTGLGLYICKAIVEQHGGTIWVRSQEGLGSTFGFTLPIYSTVAQKLASGDNKDITQRTEGWIKNHAMYRR